MPKLYPLLPLREFVVFPHMRTPLRVGRPGSIAAVERALQGPERELVLVAQVDRRVESPGQEDLYTTGTLARVLAPVQELGGVVRIVTEGLKRVRLRSVSDDRSGYSAEVEVLDEHPCESEAAFKLKQRLMGLVDEVAGLDGAEFSRLEMLAEHALGTLLDKLVVALDLDLMSRQDLLEEQSVKTRAQVLMRHLERAVAERQNEVRNATAAPPSF